MRRVILPAIAALALAATARPAQAQYYLAAGSPAYYGGYSGYYSGFPSYSSFYPRAGYGSSFSQFGVPFNSGYRGYGYGNSGYNSFGGYRSSGYGGYRSGGFGGRRR